MNLIGPDVYSSHWTSHKMHMLEFSLHYILCKLNPFYAGLIHLSICLSYEDCSASTLSICMWASLIRKSRTFFSFPKCELLLCWFCGNIKDQVNSNVTKIEWLQIQKMPFNWSSLLTYVASSLDLLAFYIIIIGISTAPQNWILITHFGALTACWQKYFNIMYYLLKNSVESTSHILDL